MAALRSRGLDLNFSRMRLHSYRGIIAENVRFGPSHEPRGLQLFAKEVDVGLNNAGLLRGEIQLRSLTLRQGNFIWPLDEPDQSSQQLRVDNIMTELRFLPNDQLELDSFQAVWLGAKIKLSGTLTNASLVRSWKMGSKRDQPSWARQWRQFLTTCQRLQFLDTPEIRILARADGREPGSFRAGIFITSGGASTPWGNIDNVVMTARWLSSAGTNSSAQAELNVKARAFENNWAKLQHTHFLGQFSFLPTNAAPARGAWQLEISRAETRWGNARDLQVSGKMQQISPSEKAPLLQTGLQVQFREIEAGRAKVENGEGKFTLQNSLTNWMPLAAAGQLTLREIQTDQGKSRGLQLATTIRLHPPDSAPAPDASWGWWTQLAPYEIGWQVDLDEFDSSKLKLQRLFSSGQWRAPALELSELEVELYGKHAEAQGRLNVSTREVQGRVGFDFDVHQIAALFSTNGQRWLQKYAWETPPQVQAQARVVLPSWADNHPNWRGEVSPTLWLQGNFQVGPGSFRTIPVSAAQSHFSFSNSVWRLPDLTLDRPEGRLNLGIAHSIRTETYRIDVRGPIFPKALVPLFGEVNTKLLNLFEFRNPAVVDASVWGPWNQGKGAIAGQTTIKNMSFRDEEIHQLDAIVQYTNRFAEISRTTIQRDGKVLTVPLASYDIDERMLMFSNIQSTIDPMVVARALGPKIAKSLKPYQFESPPAVRVNGSFSLKNSPLPNLTFDIAGGPFRWQQFTSPQISGTLRWNRDLMTISNLQGSFYNGQLAGLAHFNFGETNGTAVSFQARASEVDLHLLMRDLVPKTNKLEGTLSCDLVVNSGNTADLRSWQGQGSVKLRDGLLWDIPAFGIFSPILNAILPGLGHSRAEEASASFIITNSVAETKDLDIRASAMRLQYRGTVDFQGKVNARVEAKLLHDAKAVGPLVSLIFTPLTKIFEYKITGTLSHPKKEPLFIPKLFTIPFHPIRALREIFPLNEESSPPLAPKGPGP